MFTYIYIHVYIHTYKDTVVLLGDIYVCIQTHAHREKDREKVIVHRLLMRDFSLKSIDRIPS